MNKIKKNILSHLSEDVKTSKKSIKEDKGLIEKIRKKTSIKKGKAK